VSFVPALGPSRLRGFNHQEHEEKAMKNEKTGKTDAL